MKQLILTVLGFVALLPTLQAQDVITKRSGEKVNAKVLEISTSEVRYKNFGNQDGPVYVLPKNEVMLITYENKTSEVFEVEELAQPQLAALPAVSAPAKPLPADVPATSAGLYMKGQTDADHYYDAYRAAGTGTLIVSLLSPAIGLIPAVATSVTTPRDKNWDAPNSELLQYDDYKSGYRKGARKKKSRKVWLNWGIGLGANIVAAMFIANNY